MLLANDPGTLGGSALASWTPLVGLLGVFGVVLVTLFVVGRTDHSWAGLRILSRPPEALQRLTGVPGWAAVAIGLSMFGLFVAGQGFYSDVSWHIALGRDDQLLTAPHASILLGLVFILGAAVLGTVVATMGRVDGALRVLGLRVPRSLLPLWALGLGAVAGFPLDEVWHQAYGVDVTMWSPTHMLMILGATFTPLAAWGVLAGSGVRPSDGRWARGLHVVCGWLALQGLVAPLGEFSFGVPQFSLLFPPIIVSLAAGLALPVLRHVLGAGWTLGIVAVSALMALGGESDPVPTRTVALFIVSAVVVEVVALIVRAPLAQAIVAGLGIGTLGLAAEWWWNQGALQPWASSLLPEAVLLAVAAAIGAALLGRSLAQVMAPSASGARVGTGAAIAGGVVCIVVVLGVLPRSVGNVSADISVVPAGEGTATIEAVVSPAGAADDAYWFQATAWQGGGLVVADMEATGEPGRYRSSTAMPIDGHWKTLLRLHRGQEMMTIPIWLPADPTIGEPEIAAVDRTAAPFASERDFLLRETYDGNGWLSPIVHAGLLAVVLGWAASFVAGLGRRRPVTTLAAAAP